MDAELLHSDNEDSANAPADLNHRWAHMSEGTFSDVVVHIADNVNFAYFPSVSIHS